MKEGSTTIADSGDHMTRRRRDAHLYELAKLGAEAQFRDLIQEVKYLIELFPHLRDSVDKDELPLSFIVARDSRKAHQPRRRRRMSAAARKKISQAQKKRWAAQRTAKAKV
jgi:hypothetical protein